MAGTTGTHADEFARIASKEHNVALHQTENAFGPQQRFPQKSQTSNPMMGGGINRATAGKKGSKYSKHSNT